MAADQHATAAGAVFHGGLPGAVGRPDAGDHIALLHMIAKVDHDLKKTVVLAEQKTIPIRHIERHRRVNLHLTLKNSKVDQHIAQAFLGDGIAARGGHAAAAQLRGDQNLAHVLNSGVVHAFAVDL